mmetsp:Transcript_62816/g.182224  ORF Transcript_62816/g.182224 Transcript_62816/m.182224 type:complete len:251 (-) Transcript_62816:57-809(-)
MTLRKSLAVLILTAFFQSVHSFGIRSCPSTGSGLAPASLCPLSTCWMAEDDSETEAAPREEVAPTPAAAAAETDILNSPAFLKRKIDVLKSDIAAIDKEIEETRERAEAGKAEWGPQLEDLKREYKNIQDRMATQSQFRDMEVTRSVVRDMLEVLDNFDRAFGVIKPQSEHELAIEAEYKEAYQMIMDVITSLGVEEVKTVGTEFDYELHQAVMQKPSDEYEEGIVCEEFQKGFKIGDTLIRAAMVAVAV